MRSAAANMDVGGRIRRCPLSLSFRRAGKGIRQSIADLSNVLFLKVEETVTPSCSSDVVADQL